jgi:hypothetical protein
MSKNIFIYDQKPPKEIKPLKPLEEQNRFLKDFKMVSPRLKK